MILVSGLAASGCCCCYDGNGDDGDDGGGDSNARALPIVSQPKLNQIYSTLADCFFASGFYTIRLLPRHSDINKFNSNVWRCRFQSISIWILFGRQEVTREYVFVVHCSDSVIMKFAHSPWSCLAEQQSDIQHIICRTCTFNAAIGMIWLSLHNRIWPLAHSLSSLVQWIYTQMNVMNSMWTIHKGNSFHCYYFTVYYYYYRAITLAQEIL